MANFCPDLINVFFRSGYGSQAVSSSNLTNDDCLSLRSISVDETPDFERKESISEVERHADIDVPLKASADQKTDAVATLVKEKAGFKTSVANPVLSHPLQTNSPRSSSDDVSTNPSGESEPHIVNTGLPAGKVCSLTI